MNEGRTSYFHNSLGGYHAAKPRRYNELFDYQIARNNFEMLNMLNVKYIIFADQQGNQQVQRNEEANGNAWFVEKVEYVNSADEEIKALDSLNSKTTAVVNVEFRNQLKTAPANFTKDSTASVTLSEYHANALEYQYSSSKEQLVLFSDIYYKDGWNAYIDGKLVDHLRANYVLRALRVPAGDHTLSFRFEPTIIKQGNTITLASYGILGLLLVLLFVFRKKQRAAAASKNNVQ